MTPPRLGQLQLNIMEVLWGKGRATAREITDAVNAIKPVAHSTIQTLLRKLEKKGAVAHEIEDRTFYFRAIVEPEGVRMRATREFIDKLYEGSASSLVAYLLRTERIPQTELEKIRALIEQTAQKGKEC